MSRLNLDAPNETFGDKSANWFADVLKFLETHGFRPALLDEMMKRPRTAGLCLDAIEKIIEADMYVMLDSVILQEDSEAVVSVLESGVELHIVWSRHINDGGQVIRIVEHPQMKTYPVRIPPVGWVHIGYGVEMSLDCGRVFLVRRPRSYTPAPQPL